ncbi:hypothetical protein HC251_06845 [Iamia sp. SCSIO 61187]|uniref:hypothetical protein n=1 Tax=Iamia sp. SCSIO 61187 TaxID=2722752 RepID=UPI001C63A7D2|nr:hypothetical protein [Iamia sp. SCSIO 61187]QYG92185.1 hypothetical protein HC251_06845 [Iamia sp. SCSIO 61187]
MTDGLTLRLHAFPPRLMVELLATLDSLHREVQVAELDEEGGGLVSRAAHDALVTDRQRVEGPRNVIHDRAVAARDAGEARTDVAVRYTADQVTSFLTARSGVQEADAAAQRGDLLAAPMTPEQRHLWLWVGAEFAAQAAGALPTPYVGPTER